MSGHICTTLPLGWNVYYRVSNGNLTTHNYVKHQGIFTHSCMLSTMEETGVLSPHNHNLWPPMLSFDLVKHQGENGGRLLPMDNHTSPSRQTQVQLLLALVWALHVARSSLLVGISFPGTRNSVAQAIPLAMYPGSIFPTNGPTHLQQKIHKTISLELLPG